MAFATKWRIIYTKKSLPPIFTCLIHAFCLLEQKTLHQIKCMKCNLNGNSATIEQRTERLSIIIKCMIAVLSKKLSENNLITGSKMWAQTLLCHDYSRSSARRIENLNFIQIESQHKIANKGWWHVKHFSMVGLLQGFCEGTKHHRDACISSFIIQCLLIGLLLLLFYSKTTRTIVIACLTASISQVQSLVCCTLSAHIFLCIIPLVVWWWPYFSYFMKFFHSSPLLPNWKERN